MGGGLKGEDGPRARASSRAFTREAEAEAEAEGVRAARLLRWQPEMLPTHFPPGEGKSIKLGRMTMTFKTTASQDWNAYTVCEAVEPPESGAGYHRHPTYDETFIILEGHYDFRLEGKLLKLAPGDVVFVPRGTPHGFVSTGPEVGRQIIISSPGGIFDAMIAEVTMLDTGSPTREAAAKAKAIAAKYGLEFLGA